MSLEHALPTPPPESIVHEDEWLYVCLALYPMTAGHVVVVWKNAASDLHLLSDDEYDYLMEIMDIARDTMLEVLGVEKVYLVYMDEAKQVHWHLVPRYNERGFNVFAHKPQRTSDFALASKLREAFQARHTTREIHFPQTNPTA